MGANKVIPFSSFHRYQREDSAWANALIPEIVDYGNHAMAKGPEILPPFVRVNCETDEIIPLQPLRLAHPTGKTPEEFGDNWSDPLSAEDKKKIRGYLTACESLRDHFGFITVTAGGSSVTIDLNRDKGDVGLGFDCPRNCLLMAAINGEVFDDLLIGNYMRARHYTQCPAAGFIRTLHRIWPSTATMEAPRAKRELSRYFNHYYSGRDPIAHIIKRACDRERDDPALKGITGGDRIVSPC